MDVKELNQEIVDDLKKAYNAVKRLSEEKKSIAEDISEEKKDCAKKTGMSVRDVNAVFKLLTARENESFSEDYLTIAKAIEGKAVLAPSKSE